MKSEDHVELELKRLEDIKRDIEFSLMKGEINLKTHDYQVSFYNDKIEALKWVLDK